MTADRERTRRSRRNRGATARWNGRATMATVCRRSGASAVEPGPDGGAAEGATRVGVVSRIRLPACRLSGLGPFRMQVSGRAIPADPKPSRCRTQCGCGVGTGRRATIRVAPGIPVAPETAHVAQPNSRQKCT